jgi:hypothetical protein
MHQTDKYNDIECPVDEAALATLMAAGVDATLSRHIAHLFVRDPLVISISTCMYTHTRTHAHTHTHTHTHR